MKRNLTVILLSVVLSVTAAVIITNYINESPGTFFYSSDEPSSLRQVVLEHQNFPDFTYAAESCVDGVVFVKVVKRDIIQNTILQRLKVFAINVVAKWFKEMMIKKMQLSKDLISITKMQKLC